MLPDYDSAKRIAAEGDEAARLALAMRADLAPELLFFLAADKTPGIRAAVAANAATPAKADRLLADDADPAIRALVGRKLAPRAPELAGAGDRVRQLAWRTLCGLAADTAVMVRAVIAEELSALPNAPRELIMKLARDAAMEVAGPVIRFSPQLSEDDLLALLASPPVPATVIAVARRPALSERLSDAVAARADEAAIAALLDNPSAAIREQTLDGLIAESAGRIGWQESLVRRPSLPAHSARALALIVAEHLLQPLAARPDLDPALAETLRNRVAERLEAAGLSTENVHFDMLETAFEAAGRQGDRTAMARHLARAAKVPLPAVERASRLRSAKAMVSLCWQANFGPTCVALAQSVLGQVAPKAVLVAPPKSNWPLSLQEMRWQIELLQAPEPTG